MDTFTIDSSLSGLGVYPRASQSLVAWNLSETIGLNISISHSECSFESSNGCLDASPLFNGSLAKNFSIPFVNSIRNFNCTPLNIRRFLVSKVIKVLSETVICECCLLYSFFNENDALIHSTKFNFNYIFTSPYISEGDLYTVVSSDVQNILESCTNSCSLDETLGLKILIQRTI